MAIDGIQSLPVPPQPDETLTGTPKLNIDVGDFIVGKLIYDFGTRKESEKRFIGQIIACDVGREKNQYKASFLRKVISKSTVSDEEPEYRYNFIFPNIADEWLLSVDQIIEKVELAKVNRGKHYFKDAGMVTCMIDID